VQLARETELTMTSFVRHVNVGFGVVPDDLGSCSPRRHFRMRRCSMRSVSLSGVSCKVTRWRWPLVPAKAGALVEIGVIE